MDFRWNDWNLDHVVKHGVTITEAEIVVAEADGRYPQRRDDDKWIVIGRGNSGRWVQVVFLIDDDDSIYIIHARPLTDREKRRERRKNR